MRKEGAAERVDVPARVVVACIPGVRLSAFPDSGGDQEQAESWVCRVFRLLASPADCPGVQVRLRAPDFARSDFDLPLQPILRQS
jgi:hypothetical protein